jgi:hypothetical protein
MEIMKKTHKEGFIMYTLFIGGIVLVAFMPLLNGTRRDVVDAHHKTSLDDADRIERGIQQAKAKVAEWGFYSQF